MVRIILSGCNGHMGRVLTDLIAQDPDTEVAAGIDVNDSISNDYPVYKSPADCSTAADVMIDFSNYRAVDGILDYCAEKKMPLVLCTTGLSGEQIAKVEACSGQTAILRSANMSVGVNLLLKLLKQAAGILAPSGYDMEIVEEHHKRKLDAPSGTAIALADSLNEGAGGGYHYTYERASRTAGRDPREIGISSVRGGSIVGVHDVIFAGSDEVIEFKHTAYSRAIFGNGAIAAAKFLCGKEAGLYDMSDVIG